ncbi:MAG: TRAP transporter substrate-binding protein [Eubacterium sp.]
MNKKKLLSVLVGCFMICTIALSGCGSSDSGNSSTASTVTLKLNQVNNEKSVYYQAAQKFKEEVEKNTDGNVKIEIYSSGQLGNERDMVESMQYGTIDVGMVASAVLGSFVDEYALLDAPFLYDSDEQAKKVTDGKVGDFLGEQLLSKQKIRTLGYYQNGFRDVFSNRPVTSLADFKGLKIRTMENKLHQKAFTDLGALPVPMPFGEVFTGLQQGTIDAAENSLDSIYSQKFYEATKNVTLTDHAFGFVVLCMSDLSFNKIPKEYQQAVQDAASKSVDFQVETMKKANEEAKSKLEAEGVTIHKIDREELKKACGDIETEYKNMLPEEYLKEIKNTK